MKNDLSLMRKFIFENQKKDEKKQTKRKDIEKP